MVRRSMRSLFSNFDWYYFRSGAISDLFNELFEGETSNEKHRCYKQKRCTDYQDIERLRKSHIDLLRVNEADDMREMALFKAKVLLHCRRAGKIHHGLRDSRA